jgi:DNA polymerase-3 subunit delta
MKLRADQIPVHLEKGLAPVYLVSGDEPFQLDQVVGAVRRQAQQQGYTDRQVLQADARFDWNSLGASASNMSLFAEKQLIELRLPSGKPGAEGSKALQAFLAAPPADTLLLIISAKIDRQQQNSKWYKAIEQAGVTVAVWPIEAPQLPAWLKKRMALRDMQPSEAALQMLVDRVEGNLLAADQELEKLRLLTGGGPVDAEQVAAAVADSARYDLFSFVDVTLAGDLARAQRMLFGLRAEGVEAILVLWALSREIRSLAGMATALEAGKPLAAVLQQYRVWDKRKAPLGSALRRYPRAADWRELLQDCHRIDLCLKGQAAGAPWEELLQLIARLAGHPLFQAGQASG